VTPAPPICFVAGASRKRAIAEEDPYARGRAVRPECVEWQLVGINPDAIDPDAVIRPQDLQRRGVSAGAKGQTP
jgi:hypothetical protein